MSNQDIVKFGDTFYLKHQSSKQYLVNVDRGRRNWPKLSNTGRVTLQIVGGEGAVIANNSFIKIKTTEDETFNNDILGAFADSHDCYYWKDNYDDGKQSWRITKASGNAGPIYYDESVYITNVSYHDQRLALDTKNQDYITTVENAGDCWILESTSVQSVAQPSSPKSSDIFSWSVASGDPTTDSVILWTRVNPERYRETIALEYEVAINNDKFKFPGTNDDLNQYFIKKGTKEDTVVLQGTVPASEFGENADYTVHINLKGLEPNKSYFYRFIYKDDSNNNVYSPIGRCRTLPNADTPLDKLSLAVLTCNDYSTGYFNAFYELADEHVDFVIHLGDFVYEYLQYPPGYGDIVRTDLTIESNDYPHKDPANCDRATSLEHFRHIYQTYRQDPALQRAMEKHTWLVTLDDHEIADNCYWEHESKAMDISVEKPPFHPIHEHLGKDSTEAKTAMLELYKNATQAWREYIPALFQKLDNSEPNDPRYKLYREFRFGSLVDFFLTDSRSFRDKPDLEINAQILEKVKEYQKYHPKADTATAIAEARNDLKLPEWKASMLGKQQKDWLIEGIKDSKASWKVWGNQTFLATAKANEIMGEIDDWHGFKAERYEILQRVKDSETLKNKTDRNSRFVVFTGDMHTSLVAYLKTEFEGLGNKVNLDYSKLAGVEFMTPSVTSPGISEGVLKKLEANLPVDILGTLEKFNPFTDNSVHEQHSWQHKASTGFLIKKLSPHIEHYDSRVNGYAIAEFTANELNWKVYRVDRTDHDKLEDGRNVSTTRAKKELAQSVKYNPNGIQITDSLG